MPRKQIGQEDESDHVEMGYLKASVQFLCCESGAVAVDLIVMTFGVVMLCIMSTSLVMDGEVDLANRMVTLLQTVTSQ